LGQPALSINWGAWAGEGFADSAGGKRLAARLALLGIGALAPAQALDILGRLLRQRATQVMAVPVDWKQYREFYPDGSTAPLRAQLARGEAELLRPVAGTSERRTALLAAAPDERRALLRSYLSEQVARVLGLSPSKLDLQQPLSQLGMDSLMAVELKNRIAADFKLNIPVVKFLQGFSIDQAVTQMLNQLADEAAHPAMAPLAAADGNAEFLLAKLDQLSDEEVGSLLADMLAEEKAGSAVS
jgi:myxalamid-type polyketide synthase MxaE and MxaD